MKTSSERRDAPLRPNQRASRWEPSPRCSHSQGGDGSPASGPLQLRFWSVREKRRRRPEQGVCGGWVRSGALRPRVPAPPNTTWTSIAQNHLASRNTSDDGLHGNKDPSRSSRHQRGGAREEWRSPRAASPGEFATTFIKNNKRRTLPSLESQIPHFGLALASAVRRLGGSPDILLQI